MPTWQRRHSRRACLPDQARGPARGRRRHAMVAEALVPPCADRVAIRIVTRDATVYTNAPKRPREAVFGDLCTLLHPHRPPARASRRRSRHNSVHKCPRTASRGRFRRSVYTIASPPAARATPVSQQCTQMAQNSSERPFSAICVHYCVPTGRSRNPRVATVYTNGPEQLREAVFGDLCTLLCPPASPRPPARASRRNSVHNHEAPNIPAPGRRTSPRSG